MKKDESERFNAIYRRAVQELDLLRPTKAVVSYPLPSKDDWNRSTKASEGGEGSNAAYSDAPVVKVGTGTGFVVAPGYVLTNRHVVEGCTEILVVNPTDHEKKYHATVIASQDTPDLALLKVGDGIQGGKDAASASPAKFELPAIALANQFPGRGEDIMALGFPGGTLLGLEMKSTKGAVVSSGDVAFDGNFLHSCIINPGNSGGPIVNQYGELIGVVVAIVKTSSIGNSYSIGIPIDLVGTFLKQHLPKAPESDAAVKPEASMQGSTEKPSAENADVGPTKMPRELLPWPKVDAKVSPSTVFIIGKSAG
jgi:S1-C subfamily serine protease